MNIVRIEKNRRKKKVQKMCANTTKSFIVLLLLVRQSMMNFFYFYLSYEAMAHLFNCVDKWIRLKLFYITITTRPEATTKQ